MDSESESTDGDGSSFELVESHEAHLPSKELDKIRKWLHPTDYAAESSEFSRHLLSRAPGTGTWICETERYKRWRGSPHHGCIWIKGVPGAGKSVLAASIVEDLRTSEVPVLFFFFRHIILANRHPVSLMRDWLAQLLPHSISVQGALHPMIKEPLANISENVFWDCIMRGLQDVPRAFCVIDALDEMEKKGSEAFLHCLNRLATSNPARIKLFMTSRPRQDLQSCLSAASIIHISLEEDRVAKEIELYIQHRLSQNSSSQEMDHKALARKIASRSQGLFLYAKLLIDQVLPRLERDADIDFKSLPVHLEDMYNRMLAHQAAEVGISTEIQVSLLGLITHAMRPLRLRELAGFLNHQHQLGSLKRAKDIARNACHPLVLIMEDETIQVIHHSFTEFLLDDSRKESDKGNTPQFPIFNPSIVHRDLAISSLEMLTTASSLLRSEHENPRISLPFMDYAQENYAVHASFDEDTISPDLFAAIKSFCNSHEAQGQKAHVYWYFVHYDYTMTPLRFAAKTGLKKLAHQVLNDSPSEEQIWPADESDNSRNELVNSPFGIACQHGHIDIMKMIWSACPKNFNKTQIPDQLLKLVLSHNYYQALEYLLQIGLQPDPITSEGWDWEDIARLLRDTSAECLGILRPYLSETVIKNLYCIYASRGYIGMLKVVMSMTEPKADWGTASGSALYQACAAEEKTPQHVDCVNLLLSTVTDVNNRETIIRYASRNEASRQPEKERTVLHALAANWFDGNHDVSAKIFELLMKAGADLEARDGMGDTPILCLFPKSFNKSVRKPLRYLLDAGANVSVRDNEGAALIHRAVMHHIDISLAEILLDHGADVNVLWQCLPYAAPKPPLALFWDDTDWAELSSFFGDKEKGHELVELNTRSELAKYLVQKGARIDAGGNPVEVLGDILQCCDLETFELLLAAKSEESSIDQLMFSIRKNLERDGRQKDVEPGRTLRDPLLFIKALISAGISTEVRDENGATPLLDAVTYPFVFDAFVRAGADKQATDYQGRGALCMLFADNSRSWTNFGVLERLRELVGMGFDPRQVDKRGISLLHLCMTQMRNELLHITLPLIEQLIEYGVSPQSRTRTGLTLLHFFFDQEFNDSDYDRSPETILSLLTLLEKVGGLDINAQDEEGLTPLHLAAIGCCQSSLAFVHVLLEHGADIRALTHRGRNVLHLAARARNSAVVGYLVDRDNELIHSRDSTGRTPLFDACISGVNESVRSIIGAGADVNVCDNQGITPLQACAEFTEEQRHWIKNEDAVNSGQKVQLDRYRPYLPYSFRTLPIKYRPYFKLVCHRRVGYESPQKLEHPEFAIISVVDILLAAGADVAAKDDASQKALGVGCRGMLIALERHMNPTGFKCDPNTSELAKAVDPRREEVLQEPWNSVELFSISDIAWLKQNGANFFTTLGMANEEDSVFERPFHRRFSFIEGVALTGLTEIMAQLGELACRGEAPDNTPMDKWTRDMISGNIKCNIPPNEYYRSQTRRDHWALDKLQTMGDYLRSTRWEVHPLLFVACQRTVPNMEMLRVLVEVCGVDINAPTMHYDGREGQEASAYVDILHAMAKTQHFWHLEAIRYLVGKGLPINGRDSFGRTALHYACASDKLFTSRLIQLLLELGADYTIQDNRGRSSIDVAESTEAYQALRKHGANMADHAAKSLWLGIGKLDIDMVQMALDSGADVNQKEPSPVYTLGELEWEIHTTPLDAGHPAVPLAGALLYEDYTQNRLSTSGEDLRESILRLLLERGADPLRPMYLQNFITNDNWEEEVHESETSFLHYVFRNIECKRKYLQILLEYLSKSHFEQRGPGGETVFLAACNSALRWTSSDAFRKEKTSDDVVDHESEEEWDSSGLFLEMLDRGADITAVNEDGDNALHILLSNPSVQERHIITFLEKPEAHALILVKDCRGFTPMQLALKILRPCVIELLLSLGASLCEPLFDPEGFTPLHRVAGQCLTRKIAVSSRRVCRLLPQPPDFLATCKAIWRRCLDAKLDVNTRDKTIQGNPPLFHYLAHHANTVADPNRYSMTKRSADTCHVDNFDDFFDAADLHVKNKLGVGALQIVVCNNEELDGEETDYLSRRPDGHDAVVMRFLVVKKGLDPLEENSKGLTSFDLAAEMRRQAILDAFKPENDK